MTIDELRQALSMLVTDSQPLPIGTVLGVLEDECETLRGELLRAKHGHEARDTE